MYSTYVHMYVSTFIRIYMGYSPATVLDGAQTTHVNNILLISFSPRLLI